MSAILTVSTMIVMMITARTMSAWLAGQKGLLIVLPSYTMPRMPPAFTLAAETLAPIRI